MKEGFRVLEEYLEKFMEAMFPDDGKVAESTGHVKDDLEKELESLKAEKEGTPTLQRINVVGLKCV